MLGGCTPEGIQIVGLIVLLIIAFVIGLSIGGDK